MTAPEKRLTLTVNLRNSILALALLLFPAQDLYSQSEKTLDSLRQAITSGSVEEKRSALYELRNLMDPGASEIASEALDDPSPAVRATAAGSVVFLERSRAASLLLPLLSDKERFVRREALFALGKVGSREATQPILKILGRGGKREEMSAAVFALGRIGDPGALDGLAAILNRRRTRKTGFLRRSSARAIGEIAKSLATGKKDDTTPTDYLPEKYKPLAVRSKIDLPTDHPVFQRLNVLLLTILGDKNEDSDVRREAAFALGEIRSRDSISALSVSSGSADPALSEASKEAIRKIRAQ